jgi:DNA-binding transcriptional ArsR family regulator
LTYITVWLYIIDVGTLESKSDVYFAIADPTRRALLVRLAKDGERNVSDLLAPFSISQPAVSKHLRILREAKLVRSRKEGRERLYAIEPRKLRQVYDWVSHFEKYWEQKLDALGEYLDRKNRKATKK